MAKIFICELQSIANLDRLFTYLDERVKEKVRKFRRTEDKERTIVAHALTKMVLSQELNVHPEKLSFTVNKFGKYGMPKNQKHFNISHSGKYVVCAIGDSPIGIDVEKRQDRDFRLFKNIWNAMEEQQFSPHESRSFYRLWTAKESYVKYLGVGMQANLKNIAIQKDGTILDNGRLSEAVVDFIDFDKDYACAVCSEEEMTIKHIPLKQIERFYLVIRDSKTPASR